MWTASSASSSDSGTAIDPLSSIFTPTRNRSRAYSSLTTPSTVATITAAPGHLRGGSQSFSPSPLRCSTDVFGSESKVKTPAAQSQYQAASETSTGVSGPANTSNSDQDHDQRQQQVYSSSGLAFMSSASSSPPVESIMLDPRPGSSSSVSGRPDSASPDWDLDLIRNSQVEDHIQPTNEPSRHRRNESESSLFRTPIRRALGTSQAYDAAAKAALAKRLDDLTACIRASGDLSPLAVASLHTKLDDLEETLYDPASSWACFNDALDSTYDPDGTPTASSPIRARPRFVRPRFARPMSLDFDASPLRQSLFGSRFSDVSAMLRESRSNSPQRMQSRNSYSRTQTPTPQALLHRPDDIIEETDNENDDTDENDDSESDDEEDETAQAYHHPQGTRVSHGMSKEDARLVIIETERLNENLEGLINNLRARQEETDHIQTILVERAERAAQRILFLQGRVTHLENELHENDSELAYLRLCLKGIEVQVPHDSVDPELYQSIQYFKQDWAQLKKKRTAQRAADMQAYEHEQASSSPPQPPPPLLVASSPVMQH
ncbi:hypothetical protein BROUX41_005196 [Berkeleyomyces rouxiae]|uniref:uncharacterized protein n=1 Tax=Berkeleyomyces rouxiae TaxID=2035830 RepID=UPI003B797399